MRRAGQHARMRRQRVCPPGITSAASGATGGAANGIRWLNQYCVVETVVRSNKGKQETSACMEVMLAG